jgi:hypothetical protein
VDPSAELAKIFLGNSELLQDFAVEPATDFGAGMNRYGRDPAIRVKAYLTALVDESPNLARKIGRSGRLWPDGGAEGVRIPDLLDASSSRRLVWL